MTFLPLAQRELRVMSRRKFTYYSRSVTGAVGLGAGLATLFAGFAGAISPGSAGHGMVCVLGITGLVIALIEGTMVTADAISSERREGTLGLLFLTDLKAHDIVLGKLAARASRSFNMLLAMLPVPALGMLSGGVVLGEVPLIMAALMNVLFVSASCGMCVSARGRSERRVFFQSIVAVFLLCIGVPLIGEAWHHWIGGTWFREACFMVSPVTAVMVILAGTATATTGEWILMLGLPHALGWALLGAACWRLHHSWRDEMRVTLAVPAPARTSWRHWWRALVQGPRRPVGDLPPLRWLAERRDSPRGMLASLSMVLLGMVLLVLLIDSKSLLEPAFLVITGFVLHSVFAMKSDAMACQALLEEKQSGMLELLLLTPIGAEQILDDTLLALKRQFMWPVVFLLGIDAVLMAGGWLGCEEPWEGVAWVLLYGLMVFLMLFGSYTSVWTQIYLGLATGSRTAATRRMLVYGILYPLMITLGLFVVVGVAKGGNISGGLVAAAVMCFGAAMTASLIGLYGHAVSQLRDHLPELASRVPARPIPKKPRAATRA